MALASRRSSARERTLMPRLRALRKASEIMPARQACSHANMVFLGFVPVAACISVRDEPRSCCGQTGSRSARPCSKKALASISCQRGTPWPSEPTNSSTAAACGASSPSGGSPTLVDRRAGDRRRRRCGSPATSSAERQSTTSPRCKIEGTITEDEELIERLEKIRKSACRQGRHPGDRFAGRHHRRRRIDLRRSAPAGRRKAGDRAGRHACRFGRLHDRQRHRPYRRAQIVDRRLDRRAGAVSRRDRADGQARHQARGGEIVAAEGRAVAVQSDHGRRARHGAQA